MEEHPVHYSHFMFSWERRWAADGARRLQARGDPKGFLVPGQESYGYLVCAPVWCVAGALFGFLVIGPLLVIGGGITLAAGLALVVVLALEAVAVLRVLQSRQTRITGS